MSRSNEDAVKEETSEILGRRFSAGTIRSLLVDITDLLELDYIVIIIDEWMSLGYCQAEFAERVRRSLFGDQRLAVKIGADQYQCTFGNGGEGVAFRGFELNAGAFVACDLDQPFRDPHLGPDFFAEALYRRLLEFEPELSDHFGVPPLANRSRFIESLFTTDRAFRELCLASNGLCRDFHVIFKICARKLRAFGLDREHRIDLHMVRHAIQDNLSYTINSALDSIDARALLFEVVVPHLRTAESQYFLIRKTVGGAGNPVIRDLLAKRLINDIPSGEVHPTIRDEFDAFSIEYGIYLDIMRAIEFTTGSGIGDKPPLHLFDITSLNKNAYVLDLAPLEKELGLRLVVCPACVGQFSSAERSYALRRICPLCFADVQTEETTK